MVVLLQDRLELERGERPPDLEPRHGPVNVREDPREVPADKERHVPLEVLALVKERDEPVCRCDHDIEPALLEDPTGCDLKLHRDPEVVGDGGIKGGEGEGESEDTVSCRANLREPPFSPPLLMSLRYVVANDIVQANINQ